MITKYILNSIRNIARNLLAPTPSHLLRNHIQINRDMLQHIETSIKENYHTGWRGENSYSKLDYEEDLKEHLCGRLDRDRRVIVPWLNNASSLQGKRVLEIGCGTGASTVALAEQGAKVTGIDIDEGALSVAKDRLNTYGVNADIKLLNANEIAITFGSGAFDFAIFFACLEHMTIAERLASLKDAWQVLPHGGMLAILETPNRLWYFDEHTSSLPFFHWLPNELAFQYSGFSSRENFCERYREYDMDSKAHFLRRGRGMSFHELDIAIGPVKNLKVVSSLSTFHGIRHKLNRSKLERRYKSTLMKIYPHVHGGFFDEYLYLIIEKT